MMFTDVVESSATKRHASLGRDNRERDHAYLTQVQTPHFAMVRACSAAHGGQEVSTTGDAFFVTFEDPTAAVRCAAEIQRRLAQQPIETPAGPLRLRIGIHSGFPEFFEGSWHGTDVDTAARVAGMATERQILISSRTYELVRQMTDVKFHARGEFAMKGVERMVLWEADWDGRGPRATAFPPLDVGRRRRRNLGIAGAVAGTIVLVAAGVYFYQRYKSGRVNLPINSRPTVAVMGFKNLGKPDVEWLSNALSEMLSTEMGASDAVRTISPEDVSTAKTDLGLASVPIYNIATLLKIRRILHSEYVISGAYVALGSAGSDSIHIDVHLQDADTGDAISSLGEDGTIGNLPELLRKVATELRGRLGVQSQAQESGGGSAGDGGVAVESGSVARVYGRAREAAGVRCVGRARIAAEGCGAGAESGAATCGVGASVGIAGVRREGARGGETGGRTFRRIASARTARDRSGISGNEFAVGSGYFDLSGFVGFVSG